MLLLMFSFSTNLLNGQPSFAFFFSSGSNVKSANRHIMLLSDFYASESISLSPEATNEAKSSATKATTTTETAIKGKTKTTTSTMISKEGNVTILDRGKYHLVVSKSPGVVCHHSEWTGSRSRQEIPMLQRVREAVGRRVNLVHRLDRGCSGCLLMTFAHQNENDNNCNNNNSNGNSTNTTTVEKQNSFDKDHDTIVSNDDHNNSLVSTSSTKTTSDATRELIESMKAQENQKTYLALVRGEGILHGQDLKQLNWFKVQRPIKDEKGNINDATTWFKFIAGQDNQNGTIQRPRVSIVLARPITGRWHQIRKHLKSLSHPILGDSSHGNSKINREFREKYNLPSERTCLHLARLRLNTSNPEYGIPNHATTGGGGIIDVTCPLEFDMWNMVQRYMSDLWAKAVPELEAEGIFVEPTTSSIVQQQQQQQQPSLNNNTPGRNYFLSPKSSYDKHFEVLPFRVLVSK